MYLFQDIFSRLAVPCVHRDVSESTPVEILSGRADEPDGQHTGTPDCLINSFVLLILHLYSGKLQ